MTDNAYINKNPQKFFVIVDGENLCLVDVGASRVEYLTGDDITYTAIHLGLATINSETEKPEVDLNKLAVQLSGMFSRGDGQSHVDTLAQLGQIAQINAANEPHLIRGCIEGQTPMAILVGRGKR